jgi:hypothetical protein
MKEFNKYFILFIQQSYRKAPEHPFPIPTNDCYSVIKYILEHPKEFDVDLNRLILAGNNNNIIILLLQDKDPTENSDGRYYAIATFGDSVIGKPWFTGFR